MAYAGHTWTTGDVITAVLLNALDTSYTALNAKAQVNGDILELYHGANKKFETSNTGGTVTGVLVADGLTLGDSENISLGVGGDFLIAHDGTYNNFTATSITRFMTGGGETIAQFAPDAAVSLYYNKSIKLATTNTGVAVTGIIVSDGLRVGDNEKISVGAGQDFELYHNGTNSYIESLTGHLYIYANATELGMFIISNADVGLYYNGSKKFATTNTGGTVTGVLVTDGLTVGDSEYISAGAGHDLKLYHNGSHSFIENLTGHLYIYVNATELGMFIISNAGVGLYYNGSLILETVADGVAIGGACKATNFEVGNNIITDSTTTRTFALTDNGMYIRFTSASDVTATIPLNSAVAFPIGTIIECINAGDSDLTITKTAGVTLNSVDSNTKLTTQFKAVTLKKVAADVWDVIGLEE